MSQVTAYKRYKILVLGGSAGAAETMPLILERLPAKLPVPVIIVRHISSDYNDDYYVDLLSRKCQLRVKEAESGELLEPATVYLAPANYHLLVEKDFSLSLTIDQKIKYCRPAIDPLFESAAEAYGPAVIGVLLSGANDDGSDGLKKIVDLGGYAIVQDPATAQAPRMPKVAMTACQVNAVLAPDKIAGVIIKQLVV